MKIAIVDRGRAEDLCYVLSREGHKICYAANTTRKLSWMLAFSYGKGFFEDWGVQHIDRESLISPKGYQEAGYDLIVYATRGFGTDVDIVKERSNIPVLGASSEAEIIEMNRSQEGEVLSSVGIPMPIRFSFQSFNEALDWLRMYVDKAQQDWPEIGRFVMKPIIRDGVVPVYIPENHTDLENYLDKYQETTYDTKIILEQFIEGTEVRCSAFFNGKRFVRPFEIQFPHKRLMVGDSGALVPSMGMAISYTMDEGNKMVEQLMKLETTLSEMQYNGKCTIEAIVTDNIVSDSGNVRVIGIKTAIDTYALTVASEVWTDQMSYVLSRVASGRIDTINVQTGRWVVGVGINVPGYPIKDAMQYYDMFKVIEGVEVAARNGVDIKLVGVNKYEDVGMRTWPPEGRVFLLSGVGMTIKQAIDNAYSGLPFIQFNGATYRTDIGQGVVLKEDWLKSVGIIDKEGAYV